MRTVSIIAVVVVITALVSAPAFAAGEGVAILRQGLLGAGTGAVATAVSGAKGDDVWKGALVGMGVNVVGGALLDIITSPNGTQTVVYARPAQAPVQQVVAARPYDRRQARQEARRRVYKAGYNNGYANGYQRGYSEGYEDASRDTGYYY